MARIEVIRLVLIVAVFLLFARDLESSVLAWVIADYGLLLAFGLVYGRRKRES